MRRRKRQTERERTERDKDWKKRTHRQTSRRTVTVWRKEKMG